MVNSKYSKDWQGWIEYIEDKIEKELHKIDSKIVINSIINNELFENKLVSSVNINKQHLKDRLTEATHYGVLHHASDCTDINLKQEHSSSYYYAYHKNKQQKIIFDFLFCIHKEANKDSKIKTLENLFKVENTKDLYKWYCQSNHETFYHRGSSSVIGWLAKARAESLKIKFDLANDRHGSPLNLLFKGQLDQYALSCFDENEFINGLEALNINNSNSINNQLDKILALPNNDLHQPSVRENIAESLKTKLDLANDRHGSSLNSPFKGKLKHEFINGLEALNINNSNSINNQLDKFLAVPDDPYQLHEISLIGKTIPHTGSLKLKFHF